MIYLPIACSGYGVYGTTLDSDITLTISGGWIRITAQVLIAIHLLFAYLIVANAPVQEIESLCNVPTSINMFQYLIILN